MVLLNRQTEKEMAKSIVERVAEKYDIGKDWVIPNGKVHEVKMIKELYNELIACKRDNQSLRNKAHENWRTGYQAELSRDEALKKVEEIEEKLVKVKLKVLTGVVDQLKWL